MSADSLQFEETLNRIGAVLGSELDLAKLVQLLTDEATALCGAQFGAFFYNVVRDSGESYMLYTISGVAPEAFSRFPMPRNTDVFRPTFSGTGVVRSDDIRKDPRYGHSAPYYGMPPGHLPVVSYLAVPVVSRSGEVLGGLFFGHAEPGVFGVGEEEIVKGLAAHAAVAIDNARLFQRSQEAIQVRDQFLSIASHELRTPLTPLRMQLQMLKRFIERDDLERMTPERLRHMAETADAQVVRLTRLVDDLLDVARINAGKFRLEKQPVDLVALVREAMERYGPQLAAAGCTVDLSVPDQMEGLWDPFRVEQAFTNLLINATKYAPRSPIAVSMAREADEAVLAVEDQGIGIADEDRDRIFRRYERIPTGSSVSGLGLGLFITRQIVEGHGGTIRVESARGKGATFTIRLPIRPPAPAGSG